MADDGLPDYLRDYIVRSSDAMQDIAESLDKQNAWMTTQWPQLVDALNSEFLLHNQQTEMLTATIQAQMTALDRFKTDIHDKMWKLLERVVIGSLGVLIAIAGWRILSGGAP